jgi:hypothetical protein
MALALGPKSLIKIYFGNFSFLDVQLPKQLRCQWMYDITNCKGMLCNGKNSSTTINYRTTRSVQPGMCVHRMLNTLYPNVDKVYVERTCRVWFKLLLV